MQHRIRQKACELLISLTRILAVEHQQFVIEKRVDVNVFYFEPVAPLPMFTGTRLVQAADGQ